MFIPSTEFFFPGVPPVASTLAFQLLIPLQGFFVSIIRRAGDLRRELGRGARASEETAEETAGTRVGVEVE